MIFEYSCNCEVCKKRRANNFITREMEEQSHQLKKRNEDAAEKLREEIKKAHEFYRREAEEFWKKKQAERAMLDAIAKDQFGPALTKEERQRNMRENWKRFMKPDESEKLREENRLLEERALQFETEKVRAQDELQKLKEWYDRCEEDRGHRITAVNVLEKRNKELERNNRALNNGSLRYETENERLRKELKDLREKIDSGYFSNERRVKALIEENERLRKEVEELNESRARLKERHEGLVKYNNIERDRFKGNIEGLKDAIRILSEARE